MMKANVFSAAMIALLVASSSAFGTPPSVGTKTKKSPIYLDCQVTGMYDMLENRSKPDLAGTNLSLQILFSVEGNNIFVIIANGSFADHMEGSLSSVEYYAKSDFDLVGVKATEVLKINRVSKNFTLYHKSEASASGGKKAAQYVKEGECKLVDRAF